MIADKQGIGITVLIPQMVLVNFPQQQLSGLRSSCPGLY